MAVLSDGERANLAAEYQRIFDPRETCEALKPEIRMLLNDLDDYLDTNAVTINLSIRVGIRSKFSAKQKARALAFVIKRRFEVT